MHSWTKTETIPPATLYIKTIQLKIIAWKSLGFHCRYQPAFYSFLLNRLDFLKQQLSLFATTDKANDAVKKTAQES